MHNRVYPKSEPLHLHLEDVLLEDVLHVDFGLKYGKSDKHTGLLELEDVAPSLFRNTPPIAQLGFSRDMKFGMDAQVENTTSEAVGEKTTGSPLF